MFFGYKVSEISHSRKKKKVYCRDKSYSTYILQLLQHAEHYRAFVSNGLPAVYKHKTPIHTILLGNTFFPTVTAGLIFGFDW